MEHRDIFRNFIPYVPCVVVDYWTCGIMVSNGEKLLLPSVTTTAPNEMFYFIFS
jgi:hypothetical protein